MDLEKIDKNMARETVIKKDGLAFYHPDEFPMKLFGLMKDERGYHRMNPEVAARVNPGVAGLNYNTAGGMVRFATDSSRVAVIAKRSTTYDPDHMTYCLIAGFDMYADGEYVSTFRPNVNRSGEQSFESCISFPDGMKKMREITVNFPAYGPVSELLVGVEEDAALQSAAEYTVSKPIVFYGSSITQGGCASRPGLVHSACLSRWLDANIINLGFSGNAKGEREMAEYIAGLDMSCLVMEYDHNAPNPEHLRATHEPFYKIIREAHPDLPIIMATRPQFKSWGERDKRLEVVKSTYEKAVAAGDKKVWFSQTPDSLIPIGNEGTVDNCHPNDLGFWHMAKGLLPILKEALGFKL